MERIYLGGVNDDTNIIIDIGSACNLMGHHLVLVLKQRLTEASFETEIMPTKKKFQFRGRAVIPSSGKMEVPIVLRQIRINAEVFVMKTEIPFLIAGSLLRQQKKEISVSDNMMTVTNH